jgi:hypothetical protein
MRFASDIVAVAEVPADQLEPGHRQAARHRLAQVRRRVTVQQLEILEAVARDDHPPGLWARVNGLPQKDGLPALRLALHLLRPVYVPDGTE